MQFLSFFTFYFFTLSKNTNVKVIKSQRILFTDLQTKISDKTEMVDSHEAKSRQAVRRRYLDPIPVRLLSQVFRRQERFTSPSQVGPFKQTFLVQTAKFS